MLRISYQKVQGYGKTLWTGALRDDAGNVVWECGHLHECRDQNNSRIHRHTGAARKCARAELLKREPDNPALR
jgi:hypothetical protein